MNWIIVTYLAYLAISVALTVWVARTLHRNGRIFLVDSFLGNEALARSARCFPDDGGTSRRCTIAGPRPQGARRLKFLPPPASRHRRRKFSSIGAPLRILRESADDFHDLPAAVAP